MSFEILFHFEAPRSSSNSSSHMVVLHSITDDSEMSISSHANGPSERRKFFDSLNLEEDGEIEATIYFFRVAESCGVIFRILMAIKMGITVR
jgi:hypothetical protein